MIERFLLPPTDLHELRARLRDTRWPNGVTDSGGVPIDDAKEFIRYWCDDFDWPAYAQMLSGGERPSRPGDWMIEGLKYRDRWESKLLRPAAWSPLR